MKVEGFYYEPKLCRFEKKSHDTVIQTDFHVSGDPFGKKVFTKL